MIGEWLIKIYTFYFLCTIIQCLNVNFSAVFFADIMNDLTKSVQINLLNKEYNEPDIDGFNIGIFEAINGYVDGLKTFSIVNNVNHYIDCENFYIVFEFVFDDLKGKWDNAKCMKFPCRLVTKVKKNSFLLKINLDPIKENINYIQNVKMIKEIEIYATHIHTPQFFPTGLINGSLKILTRIINSDHFIEKITDNIRHGILYYKLFTSKDVSRISKKVRNFIKLLNCNV